jgi:hypothetical protein
MAEPSTVDQVGVTGQVIADLVILGVAVKIIVGAVSRVRQPGDGGGAQPAGQIRR